MGPPGASGVGRKKAAATGRSAAPEPSGAVSAAAVCEEPRRPSPPAVAAAAGATADSGAGAGPAGPIGETKSETGPATPRTAGDSSPSAPGVGEEARKKGACSTEAKGVEDAAPGVGELGRSGGGAHGLVTTPHAVASAPGVGEFARSRLWPLAASVDTAEGTTPAEAALGSS